MRSRPPHRARRRWIVFAVVTVVFLGLIAGVLYVLDVGRKQTDLYQQAVAARKAGDLDRAAEILRNMLTADPKQTEARSLLIQITADQGDLPKAEELARYYLQDESTEAFGYKVLSQLALRKFDLDKAEEYARIVADRLPEFSQMMLIQLTDLRGSTADRLQSVQAAQSLATLTNDPNERVAALLYAAETLRDLERGETNAALRERFAKQREMYRDAARDALFESPIWKRDAPEAKPLLARIELLSEDAKKQEEALAELQGYIAKRPGTDFAARARSVVSLYLIAAGRVDEAVPVVEEMADGPMLLFLRSLYALAGRGRYEDVLGLIGKVPHLENETALQLAQAQALLQGDAGDRERGLQLLEKLGRNAEANRALIVAITRLMQQAGETERALTLLETYGEKDPAAKYEAALDRAVLAYRDGGDVTERRRRIHELAALTSREQLPVAVARLRAVSGPDRDAVLAYLEAVEPLGKVDARAVRLMRALVLATRKGDATDGTPWADRARAELTALADDPEVPPAVTAEALSVALLAKAPELAGRFLGRILQSDDVARDLSLRLVGLASLGEEERGAVAAGMREAASGGGPAAAWIGRAADAVERGSLDDLRVPAESWTPEGGAPQPTEAFLQLRFAIQDGNWPEAEAYARAMNRAWPDLPQGLERIAEVLHRAKKPQAILDLFPAFEAKPSREQYRIQALDAIGDKEQALAEARRLVRESGASEASLLALARTYAAQGATDRALAALAGGARGRDAALMRAGLLMDKGERGFAATLYDAVVDATSGRDMAAWTGLAEALMAQGHERGAGGQDLRGAGDTPSPAWTCRDSTSSAPRPSRSSPTTTRRSTTTGRSSRASPTTPSR